MPGGLATVPLDFRPNLLQPISSLSSKEHADFYAGRSLARMPWITAPTITDARDGLGPLFNARTCLLCHVNGNRGISPDKDGILPESTLVRLGQPKSDRIFGAKGDPVYGGQLQTRSVSVVSQFANHLKEPVKDPMPAEALPMIRWEAVDFTYPDGTQVSLRRPDLRLTKLGYGPMAAGNLIEMRNTPGLYGLGLIDRIPQAAIDKNADPDDKNGDGISGRVNQVWDRVLGKTMPGRFGLKANHPTLEAQIAAAFASDIGINNSIYPEQPCSPKQPACLKSPHGGNKDGFELPDKQLRLTTHFVSLIGVPVRRSPSDPKVLRGQKLFNQAGCVGCHVASYVTREDPEHPYLSEQRIWPYTDLLLHDMGPDLDSKRPDFAATGAEWRTPPLWGVGLSKQVNKDAAFLHDGRARTIEEAILWHGGEAAGAKARFITLEAEDRAALFSFVESL